MQLGHQDDRPSRAWPWVVCPVVGAGLLGGLGTMHPAAFVATALLAAAAAGAAGCTPPGERYLEERGGAAWLGRTAGVAAMLTAAVGALVAGGPGALALGAAVLATGWVFLVHRDPADRPRTDLLADLVPDLVPDRTTELTATGEHHDGHDGRDGPDDRSARRPAGGDRTAAPGARPAPPAAAGLAGLTDAQLRQRWRVSYLHVRAASDPVRLAQLVAARQTYLDEMQRRHPDGFAAWLAAGAVPGSDPSPFFSSRLSP